jgi:predicted nucleic acid-binding protein
LGQERSRSLTLDTGALIALERGDGRMRALIRLALELGTPVHVPAGVVAQVWRGTPRQTPIAALLKALIVRVHPLDVQTAKAAGVLCGRRGTTDVIDATVAITARLTSSTVITSDPDDITLLDPRLSIRAV